MCKERDCLEQKFVVFRSEIDLKGHMAEVHLSNVKLSRSQIKAMKRIDLNYPRASSSSSASAGANNSNVLNLSISRDGNNGNRISRSSSGTEISRKGRVSRNNSSSDVTSTGARERDSISSSSDSSGAIASGSRISSSSSLSNFRNLSVNEARSENRDSELIRVLRDALDGNDKKFEEFRQLSVRFRNFEIDCSRYIQTFLSIFGDRSTQVFPTLLDSFPDRDRRTQILEAYNRIDQMVIIFPLPLY